MIDRHTLPEGWKILKVSEVGRIETGSTPSKANPAFYSNDFPFYKPTDLQAGSNVVKASDYLSELGIKRARFLPEKSILVTCIGATIGKTGIIRKAGASNQQINAIIPFTDFDPDFIYYQVISHDFQKSIKENSVATTLPILNKSRFQNLDLLVCSLSEQQEIVAKIEELFSELDKGKEQLETVRQQLKVYRQAVLKWAFEGKLTSSQVKEGELPEGWKWETLGNFITEIDAGKSFKCDERPPKAGEIGVVKVSSVTWGKFDENESKTIFSLEQFNPNYLINEGDFLFSRANTIELVGSAVIVKKISKQLMLSDKILRFSFTENIVREYVLHYLRTQKGRREIETNSTGNQESMRNIGQQRIKQIQIPVCSLEEQYQIVQEIESRLSVCDKVEETIVQNLQQAENLRQSILKKAFEGKLVKASILEPEISYAEHFSSN